MGMVIHAEERFNERRRKADEMRGSTSPRTEVEKRQLELKAKLDAHRNKNKT